MANVTSTVVGGSARVWSSEQNEIFRFMETGKGNLVVRARAGTGKTTTIIAALDFAPEAAILLCAFNKRIADELTSRISNGKAVAKTLHAIGFGIVRRYWTRVFVAKGRDREEQLTNAVCGARVPDAVKKLVSKLHGQGREINPHARTLGDLTDILYNFECEPDEQWSAEGYDAAYIETKALAAMELASQGAPNGIDFADMIFLPVRNRWMSKSYDLVIVDEAQDMTVAQLELAQGVCRGRFVVVGDDRQAIYGFRGADSESLDRLKTALNATELTLTTTYRCGKAIVAEAAKLVPDFRAGESNSAGIISALVGEKLTETVAHGDFVLSRTNAPLVSTAMSLLRNGKRARVAGRDIGTGLTVLVRKLAKGPAANSIPALLDRIRAWETKEADRYMRADREAQVELVHDKAEMLIEMATASNSVSDLTNRIEALFTDDGLGQNGVITCSSVHRAKGLEANRVFVLAYTLKQTNREEENIAYVAITRAKHELVYVSKAA
jgi:superfamily I DNA/RNA helicase